MGLSKKGRNHYMDVPIGDSPSAAYDFSKRATSVIKKGVMKTLEPNM